MKKLAKALLRRAGYTCYDNRFPPWGINLQSDLVRLGFPPAKARVILDIGANVGSWSTSAYEIFPRATIHAFEPVPTTFETLSKTVGKRARVRTYCQGFSSEVKKTSMEIYANPRTNTMEATKSHFDHRLVGKITVPCTTLDAWVDDLAIDKIDLIKIDVEGHELHVLSGGASMLREARATFLFIETKSILASEVTGPGVSLHQLAGFLSPLGYRLLVLYTDFFNLPPLPFYTNFNALFGAVNKMTRPVGIQLASAILQSDRVHD
jgi:FkbM family methyltransferase